MIFHHFKLERICFIPKQVILNKILNRILSFVGYPWFGISGTLLWHLAIHRKWLRKRLGSGRPLMGSNYRFRSSIILNLWTYHKETSYRIWVFHDPLYMSPPCTLSLTTLWGWIIGSKLWVRKLEYWTRPVLVLWSKPLIPNRKWFANYSNNTFFKTTSLLWKRWENALYEFRRMIKHVYIFLW